MIVDRLGMMDFWGWHPNFWMKIVLFCLEYPPINEEFYLMCLPIIYLNSSGKHGLEEDHASLMIEICFRSRTWQFVHCKRFFKMSISRFLLRSFDECFHKSDQPNWDFALEFGRLEDLLWPGFCGARVRESRIPNIPKIDRGIYLDQGSIRQ